MKKKHLENFNADLTLYDGKLLYTNYSKHEPKALIIEDTALYDMQKNIFLLLWQEADNETLSFIKQK